MSSTLPPESPPWVEYRTLRWEYYDTFGRAIIRAFLAQICLVFFFRTLEPASWWLVVTAPLAAWATHRCVVYGLRFSRAKSRLFGWACPVCNQDFAPNAWGWAADRCGNCGA